MSQDTNDNTDITIQDQITLSDVDAMLRAGQIANDYAQSTVFSDYHIRRSDNTLRRQLGDLRLFALFLNNAGLRLNGDTLQISPEAWRGVTWGIIEGFKRWMLTEGYAVGSINVRLSTIKTYARLAVKAGTITAEEGLRIKGVNGFSHQEKRKVDQKRTVTRVGEKKAQPVRITTEVYRKLIAGQPKTPQGRRDTLMLCLLLEHGLRVGEVAGLAVDDIDLNRGVLHFFREKVGKQQVHTLTANTYRAVSFYLETEGAPQGGYLLRASYRGGHLAPSSGMTKRAINKRIRLLGRRMGIDGMSPHDCRHFWATRAARSGTDTFALQEAGGWNSLAMPRRYVEESSVANQGVMGFNTVDDKNE